MMNNYGDKMSPCPVSEFAVLTKVIQISCIEASHCPDQMSADVHLPQYSSNYCPRYPV